jgi:hypothetical protein
MANAFEALLAFYKTTLEYRAQVISIVFASGIAVAIPNIVTYLNNRQVAEHEKNKLEREVELKREDLKLKQQDYIAKFVDNAIDQDIELRIRFAEYFATIADNPEKWKVFLKTLSDRRTELYKRIDEIVGLLAAEEVKEPRDSARIAELNNHISRIEKQVGALKIEYGRAAKQAIQNLSVEPLPSGSNKRVSRARLLDVFGPPSSSSATDQVCVPVTNEVLQAQLETKTVGSVRTVLLKPAQAALKQVLTEIGAQEPALLADMKVIGGLCARKIAGPSVWSSHSFGIAVDFAFEGEMLRFGSAAGITAGSKVQRAVGYFERAGWVWGGRDRVPDPMHFEVGEILFESWVATGQAGREP